MKQMVGEAGLELRAHIEKIGLSAKPDAKNPLRPLRLLLQKYHKLGSL